MDAGADAVGGTSPYDFVDVGALGYEPVLLTLAVILASGPAVAAGFWGLDVLLRRRAASRVA